MTISHLLESFEGSATGAVRVVLSDVAIEDEKLAAFECGYKAGWDDAAKAQSDDRQRVTSDFAGNLQELSFTYHEAFGQMTRAMKPLLTQMVETLLPDVARKSLAPRIAEELGKLAGEAGQVPVEIVAAPENAALLHTLIDAEQTLPLLLIEEPTLGEGQVFLRFGEAEQQIDYAGVLKGMTTAVEAFFDELNASNEKEVRDAG
ncbi:hypothetical protein U5922_013320 [Aquicoccus sp. G2-2]|uniref:hypothetical protein n=1 Tax=Aquicoccus sp. G2-2 TaxID=3092120 RepID=UPI002AE093E4|nr:hypothetical protein [Aquicoccus sp. G2-2]MEA1114390.1 hypothetical protein [Aquicoccus sp. G2-2]